MKKIIYLPLLLLVLFVSVNKVSADESNVYLSDFYDTYSFYSGIDSSIVSSLISYYTSNLSNTYNYYFIGYKNNYLTLTATNDNSFYYYSDSSGFYNSNDRVSYSYNFVSQTYSNSETGTIFWNTLLYYTSDNFIFKDHTNCSANISSYCTDIVNLPLYSNLDAGVSFPQYVIKKKYVIPTYITLSNNSYVNGPVGSSGSSGLVISDLFSNPIEALQSVWQSIVNIFNLIGEFIALIPSPLKEFLISAFMLSIILGVLKIIL